MFCWGQQLLIVHQLDTLQNLVKVTVENIQIEAPVEILERSKDARVESAKGKSFLSRFKRSPSKSIKHAKPAENQALCPVSSVDNGQQIEDLSDSAQVALAMAQRVSEPEKIAASIK
jgi:hypothetical protein